MALVKKKNPEWFPSENDGLEVGETIEVTDYRRLVELGMADLVDEKGNILPLPDTVFVCAICFKKIDNHNSYVDHVLNSHPRPDLKDLVASQTEETKKQESIKTPESFSEKMAKARTKAREKRQAQKDKAKE